jgi:hypothetical protein
VTAHHELLTAAMKAILLIHTLGNRIEPQMALEQGYAQS